MPSRASNAALTVVSREARDIGISLGDFVRAGGRLCRDLRGRSQALPMSSRRRPGPITTGVYYGAKAVQQHLSKQAPRRMGPGLRRDDDHDALLSPCKNPVKSSVT